MTINLPTTSHLHSARGIPLQSLLLFLTRLSHCYYYYCYRYYTTTTTTTYLHTCTGESIPGVWWLTGTRVASLSVAAVGFSATISVVRGTLVDICVITDITVNLTILQQAKHWSCARIVD